MVALVVDDEARSLLEDLCARNQWSVLFAGNCEQAAALLSESKAPVVLCDRDLLGVEWREAVHQMASSSHGACTILLSRVVDDYLWNEVTGQGGYDVVPKPLREAEVARTVRLAWSYWNSSKVATP
jgi:DNA-binding NtrC family response regulator